MTRKHFQGIADELKAIKPKVSGTGVLRQWELTCMVMADVCQRHNSNFNRQRFYTACDY